MKIGVMGTGNIAHVVIPTLLQMENVECYAVGARTLEKAEAFRAEFGFKKAYGSYEELVQDPEVELIYVVTQHPQHYDCIMLCIAYGKPVLCEKSFTINAAQAKNVQKFAQEKGVFVAEAMWPRYMPSGKIIDDLLASGIIGEPGTLTANLSYNIAYKERLIQPERGGGALLDIGIYGLTFALMHFGTDIERIESSVSLTDTGVDGMETVTLFFKGGKMAVLTHSIFSRSDRQGIIHGEKGYIVVENINNPASISVYDDHDNLLQKIDTSPRISGYEYEFDACIKAIQEGKTEAPEHPLSETVQVMEIMDGLRKDWGLVFPCEIET